MKGRAKSIVQFIVLLSIGILLIWLSLRKITPAERQQIIEAFKSADYFWIGISMLIAVISHLLRAYRWNYLLRPAGYSLGIFNAACYVLVGYFANYGIPRMGEVTRCTLAARYDKVPFEVGFGTVITERIIDTLIFVLIFFLTLALEFQKLGSLADKYLFAPVSARLSILSSNTAALTVTIVVILAVAGAIILFRKNILRALGPKVTRVVAGMAEGVGSVRKLDRPLSFLLLSLLIWVCYFYALYTCLFSLPETSSLGFRACLTLLLFGTLGVIFSPGGLGAYPAIIAGILTSTYSIGPVPALALPWLSWGSQFILLVALGVLCLIVLPIVNRRPDVIPQPDPK